MESHVDDVDIKAADAEERKIKHDVMAHLHVYALQCPSGIYIIIIYFNLMRSEKDEMMGRPSGHNVIIHIYSLLFYLYISIQVYVHPLPYV